MLVLTIAGVMSYYNLPRNEDPAFTIKTAVVSASWPGASVEDTVNFVTDPLEKKLQEVPYLDYLESYSRPGESVIFIYLRDNTPPEKVKELWYTVRKKSRTFPLSFLPASVHLPSTMNLMIPTAPSMALRVRDSASANCAIWLIKFARTS